jgi:DNA-binding Xre family transcriptional regulator
MLMKAGASQKEIAKELGIDQENFGRMDPTAKVKRFNDDK